MLRLCVVKVFFTRTKNANQVENDYYVDNLKTTTKLFSHNFHQQ